MIRVVHVVEAFAGGILFFLSSLIEGLGVDFEHVVIHGKRESTPDDFRKYFPENTNFIEWKWVGRQISPLKDLRAAVYLYKTLRGLDFDVLHLHSSKGGFLGRVVSRLLGEEKITLYTPHGLSFLRRDVNRFTRATYVLLEKFAFKLGGIVIACSQSESEELLNRGIYSEYINNGIDCSRVIKESRNYLIKRDNSEEGRVIIGTVGRAAFQKNPLLFNEIASRFSNDKTVRFKWIGGGELQYLLTSPNIEVTGWLSREEALRHTLDLDIYISTSLWEGLPISVLEVMCLGKPLLLKRVTGNIDLVEQGVNGFLYDTVDEAVSHINYFLSHRKSLMEKMGKNSQKMALNKYSLSSMIESYRRLYEEISHSCS